MTTVAVAHRLSLAQVMGMWADPDQRVVPIEAVFPPGLSQDDVKERNAVLFSDSEANATASALRQLGLPIEVTVAVISEGGAAEGRLEKGDVLRAIDGDEVDRPETLQRTVAGHAPGDRVTLDIVRGGEEERIDVELGAHPDQDDVAFLGIGMAAQPKGDVEVEYNVSGVGGPSAGLMLSLAVVDKLSHRRGRRGRPDRRHHPQDPRRPRGRGRDVPGARRQLLRGPDRGHRRHEADQRENARRRGGGPEGPRRGAGVRLIGKCG
ncbi:MAG: PDZ domain-containing protein, partial [Propionibacteriaceae bacterium]|nr:PDZ domain-containing protein [Propionibacteriaceae bacterium]